MIDTISDMEVAVISCQSNLQNRIPTLKRYCYKGYPFKIFTGIGSTQYYDNQIILNAGDGYDDLKYKTIKLIEWFLTHSNKPFLVKVDDDTFIDTSNLKYLQHDYTGVLSDYNTFNRNREYYNQYIQNKCVNSQRATCKYPPLKDFTYAEGGCYTLSRDACKSIFNEFIRCIDLPFIQEDITIGFIASRLNIKLVDSAYNIPWYGVNKHNVSYHPCSTFHFKQLDEHKSFNSRVAICRQLLAFNRYFRTYNSLK